MHDLNRGLALLALLGKPLFAGEMYAGLSQMALWYIGGLLKHATISFGQPLDQETWREAFSLCEMADVVLTLGSSLVVEPAASLPRARIASEFTTHSNSPAPVTGSWRS